MNDHRYILEKYNGMKTRFRCPDCNDSEKTFSRYVDTETGEYLADHVGRCNRESKCTYHFKPAQFFETTGQRANDFGAKYAGIRTIEKPKPASFIDAKIFKQSLSDYGNNNFVKFLLPKFGKTVTEKLISQYFIGTSTHWPGSVVFWQTDKYGKIRTGKIMLYNESDGRRIKKPYNHITWVHSALKLPDFELRQVFFGEHLLTNANISKPVAIVESEKTSVIASAYLPQFIWLATGALNNLNAEKCKSLKGRTVYLLPDLNAFDKWSVKVKEIAGLMPDTEFKLSDCLEAISTEEERKSGLDLADYMLRLPLSDSLRNSKFEDFIPIATRVRQITQSGLLPNVIINETDSLIKPQIEILSKPIISETENLRKLEIQSELTTAEKANDVEDIWNVAELESFFKTATIPSGFKINKCASITDVRSFIDSHLQTVKAQNGKRTYLPYLMRLRELKEIFSSPNDFQ